MEVWTSTTPWAFPESQSHHRLDRHTATSRERKYQKEYMEYWNSTVELTKTGRPVDAFIMPVAPFAAARREKFRYYGYSSIINVLDYTACVVPVTNANKNVDVPDMGFQPASDLDKHIQEDCTFEH